VFQRLFFWPLFAAIMGFALGGSVAWGIMYVPPHYHAADNQQANEHPAQQENKNGFWEKAGDDPVAYFTLWLVGFTGVLAISTIGLWIVTWRASVSQARDMKASIIAAEKSAEIARDAMIAGERAFVFTTSITGYYDVDSAGLYHRRFRPLWKNSGDTPTRKMTMHSACELRTTVLPPGFDFDYATVETGTALIPPNTEIGGSLAPRLQDRAISPQDILDVQAGNKLLYFWGWAKYRDVFADTPDHITRFCFRVLPLGNPLTYVPGVMPPQQGGVGFPTVHHTEGNCSDDEC